MKFRFIFKDIHRFVDVIDPIQDYNSGAFIGFTKQLYTRLKRFGAHRQGDSSMCVQSLGWTLNWTSHRTLTSQLSRLSSNPDTAISYPPSVSHAG